MRLGIDAVSLQVPGYRAGLHHYSLRLVQELARQALVDDATLLFWNWRSRVQERAIRAVPVPAPFQRRTCRVPFRALRALASARAPVGALTGRYDVFHGPSFRLVPGACYRRSVVSIHDLRFLTQPEAFPRASGVEAFRRESADALARADAVVANSEHTRAEILAHYRVPAERIRVLYPGVGEEMAPPRDESARARIAERFGLHGPYLLALGYLEEKKGHRTLLRAFAAAGVPHQLAIAGQHGPAADALRAEAAALGLGKRLVLTGWVPPEELPALYGHAAVFAFPSRHEGFGIPVVEAMACGTPVVATRAGALPEVIGEAGLLVPPDDADALAEAIGRLLGDGALRARLAAAGLERARRFQWSAMARGFAALYRELAS